MIETRDTKQSSFFGDYVYNTVVPKNNLLRQINEQIDFSFVQELCRDAYTADNGRPAWSPVLMFKVVFLQFLYDLSDYRIEEELHDRLSFKMFIGLDVEETPPDHSSISRFRDRLGPDRFKDIFNRIVALARKQGIISNKLHIVDSTHVRAKVDLYRIKQEFKEQEPDTYIDNHSPDKDARPGKGHQGKPRYGYKVHAVTDAESEIILNVDATPANKLDAGQLIPLSEPLDSPGVLTADKGYDDKVNHGYLSENRIRNGIIPRSNHTVAYLKKYIRRRSLIARHIRPIVEHKFSELKNRHGLKCARYWGLIKMRIQTYITATVANIKRMIRLIHNATAPPKLCLRRVA
jgi:IS5 family transposase